MQKLNTQIQERFKKMCNTGKLFRVALTGRDIWDLYLDSFSKAENPVFRDPESSVHNCNHCKNFIRRYGNIVAIDENNNLISMFDVDCDDEYKISMEKMSKAIVSSKIQDIFLETFDELKSLPYESCSKSNSNFKLGIEKNVKRYTKEEAELYGVVKTNEVRSFHHINLLLPSSYVDTSGKSIEALMGEFRSSKEVFKRGMDEITLDTLLLVKDLIIQGSLLNGDAHLNKIESMIPLKKSYDKISSKNKDAWCWIQSYKFNLAKFKNELIGVLCSELSEGEELNKACNSWNKRVDPANYMKAVAPITENQKKEAQKFVEENDYIESFDRRFALIDDIKVDEIKHINLGDSTITIASIFDNVKTSNSKHKRNEFKGIEEVTINKFMKDILPTCTSVEAFLENKHENNLVTLTTAKQKDCKQMFKWNNPYSWTYNGNLAGKSMIKESVKSQGGKVDGVLRFSIMWSEKDSKDNSDLDAHCIEPRRHEIYYGNKRSPHTCGNLDIDITNPFSHKRNGKGVVENINYPDIQNMVDGTYVFFIRQFSRSQSEGFTAEIEFNGEIHEYSYNQRVVGDIPIAKVTLKNGKFSIKHDLQSSTSIKEIYGLETQQFHKVNVACLSPNYWGDNKTGNKHYFFMLDKCKSNSSIKSFHSENLEPELAKHRKVLEVLSAVNILEPSDNQLSGLGFNATVKDEVILKLKGNFKRTIKVKF